MKSKKHVKTNPWREHVKKVAKENPGKSLKEILKIAKKSYHKKKKDEE